MARRFLTVLLLIVIPLTGCAYFRERSQKDACQLYDDSGKLRPSTTPDRAISACTAIIRSGKETKRNLAAIFVNRAMAYKEARQYDRALQDYDQALAIDPKYADAF